MGKRELLKIEIDGLKTEVLEGTTILEAAQALDISIPTLCYDKRLSCYGACRVCLVEVSKGNKTELKTSCNNMVQPGMSVKTNTDRVLKARRIVVELLLARCPDSEKILRIARQLGVEKTRFPRREEECILCGLCVRMCEERMGKSAISFANRGIKRAVVPPFCEKSNVCQTCGACVSVCPTNCMDLEEVTVNEPKPLWSDFDAGLSLRSPIFIPYAQAVPNWAVIDKEHCVYLRTGNCGICKEVCEPDAIDYEQKDVIEQIDVGAIVVVPGFEEYLAKLKYDYGYSRYADVVSSIQFERIMSASGPFAGHLQRLSDGKKPKRIAFLQCIGSRDISCRNAYCSSVCCMYAIKEAVIAKEHLKDIDVTIFFMDLRAFGKDFDKYYERAKSQYGVNFKRARVCDVYRKNGDSDLMVKYTPALPQEGVAEEPFDMVVLSVGLEPGNQQKRLASKLGIRLDPNGFIWTNSLRPLETSRPGIFVGGTASGPKDIPETVIQASGTAGKASQLLADVRGTLTVEQEFPPEKDVSEQEPRIGVFVCHCGINIGSVVDVPVTAEYAKSLPYVVYAEDNLYTCSQDTQDHIREMILEHKLNRVVVASCSPRTHELLFQQTLREAGLNPHLFEMANIRDQCSWIHMNQPEEATVKAKTLVRMAVAKVALVEPLAAASLDVTPSALVIGGGLAGMTAALGIAEQGFEVTLVERQKQLGGNLRNLRSTFAEPNVQAYLSHLQEHVQKHKNISVYTDTDIESIEGFVGNFQSILKTGSKEGPPLGGTQTKIEHGVIIVATGGNEHKPDEYLYGQDKRVVTQLELEALLAPAPAAGAGPAGKEPLSGVKTAVFIQCVGSREEEHMYCSRVCCSNAVKNALKIKELSPETEVYVLYRDIRTYGFNEQYFQTARDKGVIFIQYEADNKPKVTGGNKLKLIVREPLLDCELILEPDLLVLSSRIDPDTNTEALAQKLKVPMNEDGFLLEAHVKLRPVEFATEGIFVAGLAHSPKSMTETIAQAEAAAAKACTIISKDKYQAEPTIAAVNEDICDGCGICVPVCEYNALEVVDRPGGKEEEKIVQINEAMCKGCGGCVAACPSGAMEQKGFKNEQMLAMIQAALAD